jgi:hypothetical protein
MVDVTSKAMLTRLDEARRDSYRRLQVYRTKRREAVRLYVGNHYSENGSHDRRPVNMLELMVTVYTQMLAASNPRTQVSTHSTRLWPEAKEMELAVNELIEEMRLVETIQRAVIDAMFLVGIVKVGLNTESEDGDFISDAGYPFAEGVDLEDFVIDMHAPRWTQAQFMGNRYELSVDVIREKYDLPKGLELTADSDSTNNEGGDASIREVGRGTGKSFEERLFPTARLWDLWIPERQTVLTVPEQHPDTIIRKVDWEGPEHGMYHWLSFHDVPGQILPLSPIANSRDLDEAINQVWRKLIRQSENQKSLFLVQAGSEEQAENIRTAPDQSFVSVQNPDAVKEVGFGGPAQENIAIATMLRDLFAYTAGNLDMLGGLGAQSPTLGQDKLLSQTASQRVNRMQQRVMEFTRLVVRDIAWYRWNDPIRVDYVFKEVAPGYISKREFGPDSRDGDWFDYMFDIEPFSMQYRSPEEKTQILQMILTQIIPPYMQQMMEQGYSINMKALIEQYARAYNLPELNQILRSMIPAEPPPAESVVGSNKPAQTTRTYVRENRPQRTRQGAEYALAQTALGGKVQDSEANRAVRT